MLVDGVGSLVGLGIILPFGPAPNPTIGKDSLVFMWATEAICTYGWIVVEYDFHLLVEHYLILFLCLLWLWLCMKNSYDLLLY